MKVQLNTFLQIMEGNWISQKTTYFLKNNQVYLNQFKYILDISTDLTFNNNVNQENFGHFNLEYHKNNIKLKDNYIFTYTNQNDLGLIKKKTRKKLSNYQYSIYASNCLMIKHKDKNVEYIEYIHKINSKFIISMALLKKSDKYIAISCSSNIKHKP
uniref:chromophore lyase CpcS/CpeS-like protein n=1 Tax=Polyopes affinis TaxID=194519 RepID=UPI002A7EC68B|nr:chromophore lyase CpcS/CpeS-like protein [Polyopes affinis]WOL37123.1 chromophore lyase CpcS/CpeS-like protein [Polyopes affinis]